MSGAFFLPSDTEPPTRDHIVAAQPNAIQVEIAALLPRGCRVIDAIIDASALAFGLSSLDLLGRSRCKSVAEARMVACFVARRCTRMSFPQIGKAINRDHTTVMSACARVERMRERDEWLRAALAVLLERFGEMKEEVGETLEQFEHRMGWPQEPEGDNGF